MKIIKPLFWMMGVLATIGIFAHGRDLTNTSAQVFQKIKILEARPDGLKVMHSKGVALIPFSELSEEIQKEFNYDPEKEKEFLEKVEKLRRQERIQRSEAELINAIKEGGKRATLRIFQITENGALATGYYSEEEEYQETKYRTVTKTVGLGGSEIDNTVTLRIPVKTETHKREIRYSLPDRIFVAGVPTHLVDGDSFQTMIYPCGRYQYVAVSGAGSTVKRYAITPMVALDLLLGRATDSRRVEPRGDSSGRKGFGSGFLISEDGFLLTNHHVIKGAKEIKVKTEKELLPAYVVAVDVENDIALLKIEGAFSAVAFSVEKAARLGQTVFTVGFPMPQLQGFSPKVTKGVISSLSGIEDDIRDYQIDAAVQPGNSGGPLADENGDVVGIVVARLNDEVVFNVTGGIGQNVNYAIKKSYVVKFLEKQSDSVKLMSSTSQGNAASFEEAVEKIRQATVLVVTY